MGMIGPCVEWCARAGFDRDLAAVLGVRGQLFQQSDLDRALAVPGSMQDPPVPLIEAIENARSRPRRRTVR